MSGAGKKNVSSAIMDEIPVSLPDVSASRIDEIPVSLPDVSAARMDEIPLSLPDVFTSTLEENPASLPNVSAARMDEIRVFYRKSPLLEWTRFRCRYRTSPLLKSTRFRGRYRTSPRLKWTGIQCCYLQPLHFMDVISLVFLFQGLVVNSRRLPLLQNLASVVQRSQQDINKSLVNILMTQYPKHLLQNFKGKFTICMYVQWCCCSLRNALK